MICSNCGREIADMAVVCPNCGTPANAQTQPVFDAGEEKANVGLIILAVIIPIVGIVLGIVEMRKDNKKAGKTYLIAAGISFAVGLVLNCCCFGGLLLMGGGG